MMNATRDAIRGMRDDAGPVARRLLPHRFLHVALPFSTALLLTGCGPRITNANIDALNREFDDAESPGKVASKELGVSPKEVESILGPPKRVEVNTVERPIKEVKLVRYYYEQDGQTVELHFFDNRLIARVPHFGAPAPAAAPASEQDKP